MTQSTTNQVRQVLMNELGLTRESIRELVKELVEAEVTKVTNQLVADGHLVKMVDRAFEHVAKTNKWDSNAILRRVSTVAGEMFASHIQKVLYDGVGRF